MYFQPGLCAFQHMFNTLCCTFSLGFPPYVLLSAWVFHLMLYFQPGFYTLCCTFVGLGFITFFNFGLGFIPRAVLWTWVLYLVLYFRPGFSTLCITFGLGFTPCAVLWRWVTSYLHLGPDIIPYLYLGLRVKPYLYFRACCYTVSVPWARCHTYLYLGPVLHFICTWARCYTVSVLGPTVTLYLYFGPGSTLHVYLGPGVTQYLGPSVILCLYLGPAGTAFAELSHVRTMYFRVGWHLALYFVPECCTVRCTVLFGVTQCQRVYLWWSLCTLYLHAYQVGHKVTQVQQYRPESPTQDRVQDRLPQATQVFTAVLRYLFPALIHSLACWSGVIQ